MGQRGQGWDGEAQGPGGAQGRYLTQRQVVPGGSLEERRSCYSTKDE